MLIAIALIVTIVIVFVLEMMGVRRASAGQVDTISEIYWWILAHTNSPTRWALNLGLIAGLVWAGVHLVCNCGV